MSYGTQDYLDSSADMIWVESSEIAKNVRGRGSINLLGANLLGAMPLVQAN